MRSSAHVLLLALAASSVAEAAVASTTTSKISSSTTSSKKISTSSSTTRPPSAATTAPAAKSAAAPIPASSSRSSTSTTRKASTSSSRSSTSTTRKASTSSSTTKPAAAATTTAPAAKAAAAAITATSSKRSTSTTKASTSSSTTKPATKVAAAITTTSRPVVATAAPVVNKAVLPSNCLSLNSSTPITIDDSLGPQPVSFKLSSKPSGPVTVTLSAPGLTFNVCTLSFTPDNWDTPQSIQVTPVLSGSASGKVNFSIQSRVTSPGTGACANGKIDTFAATRNVARMLTCVSSGDPHLLTFGGYRFDNHVPGTYYMIKSPDLDVIATHERSNPAATSGVSWNTAVAVRYGSSIVVIDGRNFSASAPVFSRLTNNVDGVDAYQINNRYIVELPDNSIITASFNRRVAAVAANSFNYIDISIQTSAAYGKLGNAEGGLCISSSNTTLSSKSSYTNLTSAVQSWAVPEASNFFLGRYTTTSTPSARTPFIVCPNTPSDPAILPLYTPFVRAAVAATTTKAATTTSKAAATAAPVAAASAVKCSNAIDKYCRGILSFPDTCNKIVDVDHYLESCKEDVALVQSWIPAHTIRSSYLEECRTRVVRDSLQADIKIQKQASDIAKALGFNGAACPSSCSGNGACTASGCICNPGFGGASCSVTLDNTCDIKGISSTTTVRVTTTTTVRASSTKSAARTTSAPAAPTAAKVNVKAAVLATTTTRVTSTIKASSTAKPLPQASSVASKSPAPAARKCKPKTPLHK